VVGGAAVVEVVRARVHVPDVPAHALVVVVKKQIEFLLTINCRSK